MLYIVLCKCDIGLNEENGAVREESVYGNICP